MKVKKNVSLQPYNTFNINAKAAHFFTLNKIDELQDLLNQSTWQTIPKLILGGGSNILLTQDYAGLVIHNKLMGYTVLNENKNHVWIKVTSGENWHQLVLHCVNHGYGGIENLSLIPGTVGAAPMQNIGAYGVEIRSVFESLDAIELATGTLKTFNNSDCQFGYRNSIFKNELKGQYLITHVTLKLNKNPELNTSYGAIQTTLEKMGKTLSIKSISDAVIHIRQSKLPDPAKIPNAGSFFKNPIISKSQFRTLQKKHPEIPHYPAENNQIKVPAAWLIEQCGWKGKTVGNAGIHEHQALIIINRQKASGAELKALAVAIEQSVQNTFGITLSVEVNIV